MISTNIKNLNIFKKLIITIFIFLGAIISIYYFFMYPAMNDIKKLKAEIKNQKIDLEKRIINEKNVDLLSQKLNKIEPQMVKLEKIFINQNQELEFITTMEGISQNNAVNQKINFEMTGAVKEQNYKKVPINLVIVGDYTNILNYISDINKLPYYINIYNLELSAGTSVGQIFSDNQLLMRDTKKNITAKILAYTYWK